MRLRISTQELIWGMRIEYYDDWGLGFGSELGEWIILFEIELGFGDWILLNGDLDLRLQIWDKHLD